MRELSMNEVDDVAGGVHWLVQGLVVAAVTEIISHSVKLGADFVADPPPTGPGPGHSGVGACHGGCHGG